MAAGSTYTPIATTTLGSPATSFTFSSIPSTYTDLRLVCSVQQDGTSLSGDYRLGLRVNSDSGSNYSRTYLQGDGSNAYSGRDTNRTFVDNVVVTPGSNTGEFGTTFYDLMNYSNATTYKTILMRQNTTSNMTNGKGPAAQVALWRSTSAINSIYLYSVVTGSFNTGSTFTLYGIAAA